MCIRDRVGRVKYTSLFVPGEHVAGDFYDVVPMADGRVACVLGDVCGHGMAAGLFMASLLTHLRDRLSRGEPLASAVDSANRLMAALNESQEGSEALIFATLFAASVDGATGRVECVDCGHGYGVIIRAGGGADVIRAAEAMPLGVSVDQKHEATSLELNAGDGLFVCSDGVVEQSGGDGSQFGMPRVLECLGKETEMTRRLGGVQTALEGHSGRSGSFQDDVTMLG